MADQMRIAVDLGASSGRVIVGRVAEHEIVLDEVARFPNVPVRRDGGLYWAWSDLVDHVAQGLRTARRRHPEASSVGIDSWAVDHGLLAGGRLLGEPHCYRDERCDRGVDLVHERVGFDDLYLANGLQFLPFTTAYQLAVEPLLASAEHLLLVPDLLVHHFTGSLATERTNASTTGVLDPRTGEWRTDLIERLGFRRGLFGDLVDAGVARGEIDGLTVLTTASHDTAAAIAATPLDPGTAAYVSLGTWALVGVETRAPIITDQARAANFTNEGGVAGTTRFLRNVMGTWLLTEVLREWGELDRLGEWVAAAAEVPAAREVIDVDDPVFLPPDAMATRVDRWLRDHDHEVPHDRTRLIRLLLDSIAESMARTVNDAARLSGVDVAAVHVVGGGARNDVLCQSLSDRVGLPVVAGPVEATAMGNLLGQGGFADADALARGRAMVARSTALRRHLPAARS